MTQNHHHSNQNNPNLFFRGAVFVSLCMVPAFFFSLLAVQQVKVTMNMAKKSNTNATQRHHIADPK
jgi:hypothetical protein